MKKLKSTLPNMILSLVAVTGMSGGLLGVMYQLTYEPIRKQTIADRINAIRAVAPPFDNDPEANAWEYDGITVYPAYLHGKLNGAAVKASSMNGFSGEITVMCGFEKDGTVRDYAVLQQAETPGLGSKMQEWFRDERGSRSVLGKNPGKESFYVTKDSDHSGSVDAITAATISSRAFLETLRSAYEAYQKFTGEKEKK